MNTNRAVKAGKWLLVAFAVGAAVWFSRSVLQFDVDSLRSWILSFGLWAPVVYIAAYTIRPLLFFPASILSLAGGLAFGAWMGTLYTVIGASLGAFLSFFVARKLGGLGKTKWTGSAGKIQSQMEQNGFFYVLLFRLFPGLSFDLVSYAAGVAKVRFSSFALATVIGIIPGTFALNFLGSSFISGNPKMVILGIIVFSIVAGIPLAVQKRRSRLNNSASKT
ncbi:TVP38/TMEM64 family protein [Planococcus glaciei]|uniref:TVP38/TMEM64 family membrane protein n=1 Tax=Planococcus glaciei TaxID=459472 RepID=A0A7H8QAL2_9BACL|nr:TVP38/TMEM64 family protein [Planococcus glaciei]QKX50293.1 TVP38/TMEM64 family protein [Planococcus glaciei]